MATAPSQRAKRSVESADWADDQRLEQAALGVPSHHAEREEDREHDAQEQRCEHRQPEHEGSGERPRVDSGRRPDVLDVAEDVVVGEPVEAEETERQKQHDGEHLAPQRLAQAVADDREDCAHEVSPPTASRYVSSSVEVRTLTP